MKERIIDREIQLGVLLVGLVMAVATLLTIDVKLPGGGTIYTAAPPFPHLVEPRRGYLSSGPSS